MHKTEVLVNLPIVYLRHIKIIACHMESVCFQHHLTFWWQKCVHIHHQTMSSFVDNLFTLLRAIFQRGARALELRMWTRGIVLETSHLLDDETVLSLIFSLNILISWLYMKTLVNPITFVWKCSFVNDIEIIFLLSTLSSKIPEDTAAFSSWTISSNFDYFFLWAILFWLYSSLVSVSLHEDGEKS